MFKKLFSSINNFIMKYLGFLLYPSTKMGKEERNKKIQEHYNKSS